jgi:hypothetical protein
MAIQAESWNTYGTGGDDNGNSQDCWFTGMPTGFFVFGWPLLQFVNGHSSESFSFAGIRHVETTDPGTGAITVIHDAAPWDFGSWWQWVGNQNVTEVVMCLRVRNANATALGCLNFWG